MKGMTETDLREILQSHTEWLNGGEGTRADLRWTDLRGVDLTGVDLNGGDLRGVDLNGGDLRGVDLTGANLSKATLSKANLRWAKLTGAKLTGANLRKADLRKADLSKTDLKKANLRNADLPGANLGLANLTGANLSGANLSGAILIGVDLTTASLGKIREDFICEIRKVPTEIPALRSALIEGRIDGTTYAGDCACLAGTISNGLGIPYWDLPDRGFVIDSASPRERWFLQIRPGDTPENSQACAITVAWIDDAFPTPLTPPSKMCVLEG